jgi:hypothetical protein
MKTYVQEMVYIQMFTSGLFIRDKNWIIQMFINWSMTKQNAVYPYNEILFTNKKEWNSDTCNNMDEPQKQYASWIPLTHTWNSIYLGG